VTKNIKEWVWLNIPWYDITSLKSGLRVSRREWLQNVMIQMVNIVWNEEKHWLSSRKRNGFTPTEHEAPTKQSQSTKQNYCLLSYPLILSWSVRYILTWHGTWNFTVPSHGTVLFDHRYEKENLYISYFS